MVLDFQITPDAIRQSADAYVRDMEEELLTLVAAEKRHRNDPFTFENTVGRIESVEIMHAAALAPCLFLKEVSSDAAVREASREASLRVDAVRRQLTQNRAWYRALVAVRQTQSCEKNCEQNAYLHYLLHRAEHEGAALPSSDARKELRAHRQRLEHLEGDFLRQIAEDATVVSMSAGELEGVPTDVLESMERNGAAYNVTMKYPHYLPCMRHAHREETRRRLQQAYEGRCADNIDALHQMVVLRRRIARLIGHDTWADFRTHFDMAHTARNASELLESIYEKTESIYDESLAEMKRLKGTDDFGVWDLLYYAREVQDRASRPVDENLLQQYFPLQHVLDASMQHFGRLFGMRFVRVSEQEADVRIWHPDVQVYRVNNVPTTADDGTDGTLLGYMYTDLYPREGKYTHAACFPLCTGLRAPSPPSPGHVALVCNFTAPSSVAKTSLLRFNEVLTLLHEFGHAMHALSAQSPFPRASSFVCDETDFIEAPSQMLERWAWDTDFVCRVLSRHHQTGERLQPDALASMHCRHLAVAGVMERYRLFLARFDQWLHTTDSIPDACPCALEHTHDEQCRCSPESDAAKSVLSRAYASQWNESLPGVSMSPTVFPAAVWLHLACGYDGRYYAYTYSNSVAENLYACFTTAKTDEEQTRVGQHYRRYILASSACTDANERCMSMLRACHVSVVESRGVADVTRYLEYLGATGGNRDRTRQCLRQSSSELQRLSATL